ncbi:hypothetical protein GJAV_G00156200 [Gymnothorax javanicus]|nr:hypothetical protein GJAV_G00156200 [Gymnothorax javanicus]
MCDSAQSSFNAQLGRVMESLLAAAVCEISRIFEGSLSDSRVEAERSQEEVQRSREEVQRSREEVAVLKRKLEVLEGRLKKDSSVRDTGMSVTFDPSSFTPAPESGTGLALGACPMEGPKAPSAERLETGCQVKTELQVKELESTCDSQDCVVDRVHVKEESAGEDPDLRVEGDGVPGDVPHLCPPAPASLEAVADGALRWTVIPAPRVSPALDEKGVSAAGLEAVPCRPFPLGPAVPAPGHTERPTSDHRSALDHALSSSSPALDASLANGWTSQVRLPFPGQQDGPAHPGHAVPGAQEEAAGCTRSPYAADAHGVLVAQRHPLSAGAPVARPRLRTHLGREKPYGCAYCGKAFLYPSQQRRHLLRHTGERMYSCAQCAKSFVTPSELSVHLRVHTGEKPYACLRCGKRFNRTGNLRAHERDVHLGKRPHTCAECGKTFAQKGNLRTHLQRVHQAQRPVPSTESDSAVL